MIINAVEGYGDMQRNADGTAGKIKAASWKISDVEELKYFASIEKKGGTWVFDIDDVKTVLGAFNPNLSVDSMGELYSAVSADEIKARR
jgi:hypothetical protein